MIITSTAVQSLPLDLLQQVQDWSETNGTDLARAITVDSDGTVTGGDFWVLNSRPELGFEFVIDSVTGDRITEYRTLDGLAPFPPEPLALLVEQYGTGRPIDWLSHLTQHLAHRTSDPDGVGDAVGWAAMVSGELISVENIGKHLPAIAVTTDPSVAVVFEWNIDDGNLDGYCGLVFRPDGTAMMTAETASHTASAEWDVRTEKTPPVVTDTLTQLLALPLH